MRVLGFTRQEVTKLILGELGTQLVAGIPFGFLLGFLLAVFSISMIPADLVRIPLYIAPKTYLFAMLTTIVSGILSSIVIRRKIKDLDLIAVLKSLE